MTTKKEHMLEMVRGIRAGIARSPGLSSSPFSDEGWALIEAALATPTSFRKWMDERFSGEWTAGSFTAPDMSECYMAGLRHGDHKYQGFDAMGDELAKIAVLVGRTKDGTGRDLDWYDLAGDVRDLRVPVELFDGMAVHVGLGENSGISPRAVAAVLDVVARLIRKRINTTPGRKDG